MDIDWCSCVSRLSVGYSRDLLEIRDVGAANMVDEQRSSGYED